MIDLVGDLITATILTYAIKRFATRVYAIQGYSLLHFRSPRQWTAPDLLCGALLVMALPLFLWLGPQKTVWDLVAMTFAAFLLFQHLFPRVHLREHGIELGTTFVPWNSISKFAWSCPSHGHSSLMMEGPWLQTKQFSIPTERKDVADGVISGAARLEPATHEHFALLTTARVIGWGGLVALFYFSQQL